MASIIGSGINGNYRATDASPISVKSVWLLLLEVELMETSRNRCI